MIQTPPPRRIHAIAKGWRGMTVGTRLRSGAFCAIDAHSWINLQTHYDTECAREAIADVLIRIKVVSVA